MKNNSFAKRGFLLLVLCTASFWMAAQQNKVVVGEVRNGVGVITNTVAATNALKTGLADGAQVSDLHIEWVAGTENRFYLIGNVTGDKISAKGITLNQDGTALGIGGGGVEITCNGYKCSQCRLAFRNWAPYCKCSDSNLSSDSRCDMSSRITIGL